MDNVLVMMDLVELIVVKKIVLTTVLETARAIHQLEFAHVIKLTLVMIVLNKLIYHVLMIVFLLMDMELVIQQQVHVIVIILMVISLDILKIVKGI